MNAIDILTREKLNRQHWLDQYRSYEDQGMTNPQYKKTKQELANIKRALETLELEAQRKVGVDQ